MALIGDLIVRTRGLANDPCQTIGQPATPSAADNGPGGIFSNSAYFILTYLTQWGESVGSAEFAAFSLANSTVIISGLAPPYAAIAARVYFGAASGQELQYFQAPVTFATTSLVVGRPTDTVVSAAPPYKSSAWLPDTDGDLVDVAELYRWINGGLMELGRRAGGILDQTGAAPAAGTAEFNIPGHWLEFKFHWYNGWQVIAERQSYTWLQSPVQGIPGVITQWKNAANVVLGMWPQGNTNPATTTLTGAIGTTDNLVSVVSGAGFTAPGLCQIDSEVMSYSQSAATQLTGMNRPYGGTIAVAHQAGAPVTQLIVRLLGYRLPTPVVVGQSAQSFDMPEGWTSVLSLYLEAHYKRKENDVQSSTALMQEFEEKANELRDNQLPLHSKQIGGLYPFGGAAQSLAEVMDTVVVN